MVKIARKYIFTGSPLETECLVFASPSYADRLGFSGLARFIVPSLLPSILEKILFISMNCTSSLRFHFKLENRVFCFLQLAKPDI